MPASARSSESILAAHLESDGQRRSEQFRRSDLKDESQPLIFNLTTLCHPPGKPSGGPLSETSPKHPTFRSPFGRRHVSPSAEPENIFPDVVRVRHASRSSSRDPIRWTFRPPSECLPNATLVPECPRQIRPSGSHPNLPPVPSA